MVANSLIFLEGKISLDEPAILPPLPLVPKDEKRKSSFGTPQSKRLDYRGDRDWERDFELMPPPGSHKKSVPAPVDVDQPSDPNEPTYCVCHQVLLPFLYSQVGFKVLRHQNICNFMTLYPCSSDPNC